MSILEDRTKVRQTLWHTPLRQVARYRKNTPEGWHAQVLAQERDRLQVAVRSLEFALGFDQGRTLGRVESVLAAKLVDPKPGAAPVAAAGS